MQCITYTTSPINWHSSKSVKQLSFSSRALSIAYLHIYIYIQTHTHTHTYIYIDMYIYVYIYIEREVTRIRAYVCRNVLVFLCLLTVCCIQLCVLETTVLARLQTASVTLDAQIRPYFKPHNFGGRIAQPNLT